MPAIESEKSSNSSFVFEIFERAIEIESKIEHILSVFETHIRNIEDWLERWLGSHLEHIFRMHEAIISAIRSGEYDFLRYKSQMEYVVEKLSSLRHTLNYNISEIEKAKHTEKKFLQSFKEIAHDEKIIAATIRKDLNEKVKKEAVRLFEIERVFNQVVRHLKKFEDYAARAIKDIDSVVYGYSHVLGTGVIARDTVQSLKPGDMSVLKTRVMFIRSEIAKSDGYLRSTIEYLKKQIEAFKSAYFLIREQFA